MRISDWSSDVCSSDLPGGSTDQLARLMGDRLSAAWGQTVVIENKPGAGLPLGAAHVADAPADGYTLLMGAVHHSIAQSFYKNLSYDVQRDLAPVSIVAIVPNEIGRAHLCTPVTKS